MIKFLKNKAVLIILTLVIIDQIAKVAVLTFACDDGYPEWIPSILKLEVVSNTGATFGVGKNSNISMIITNLLVIIIVAKFFIFQNKRLDKKMKIALPLILAGGISNLIDRIVRGHVVDYIRIGNLPIFNIADVFVIVGWILFALSLAIYTGKELGNIRYDKRNKKNSEPRGE